MDDEKENMMNQSCRCIKAPAKGHGLVRLCTVQNAVVGTRCCCHGNTEQVMDCWKGTEKDLQFKKKTFHSFHI